MSATSTSRCVGPGAQQLVLTLSENLSSKSEALRRGDEEILTAVDHGDRLEEMQGRLRNGGASRPTTTIERTSSTT